MKRENSFAQILGQWVSFPLKSADSETFQKIAKGDEIQSFFSVSRAMYLSAIGRSHNEKAVDGLVAMVFGLYLSSYVGIQSVYTRIGEKLDYVLKENSEFPLVKKLFPENKYSLSELLEKAEERGFHGGIVLTLLALAGKEDADLVEELQEFGRILDARMASVEYERSLMALKNKKYEMCSYIGLSGLRDLTKTHAALASLEVLPSVEEGKEKEVAVYLADKISRFDIERDVQALVQEQKTKLEHALVEIQDIFTDYSQGTVRKEALKAFVEQSMSYFLRK